MVPTTKKANTAESSNELSDYDSFNSRDKNITASCEEARPNSSIIDCSDSPTKHRNLGSVINGTNRIYGGVIKQLRWVGGFMINSRNKNSTSSSEENLPNSSNSTTSPLGANGGELAPILNDCSDLPTKHRNLEAVINGTNRIYGGVIKQLRWVGGFMINSRDKNSTASSEENRPNSSNSTTSSMGANGGELAPISNDCSDSPTKHRNLEAVINGTNRIYGGVIQQLRWVGGWVGMVNSRDKNSTASSEENRPNSSIIDSSDPPTTKHRNLEAVINGTNRIYGGVIQQLRWVGGFMINSRDKNSTASSEENRPNLSNSTTSPMGANGGELAPISNDCSDSPTKHRNLEAVINGTHRIYGGVIQQLRWVGGFMINSRDKNNTASSVKEIAPISNDCSDSPTKHRNLEAVINGTYRIYGGVIQQLRWVGGFMINSRDKNSTASPEENRPNSSNSTTSPMGENGGELAPISNDCSDSPTKHRNLEAVINGTYRIYGGVIQQLRWVGGFMINSRDKNNTASSEENRPNPSSTTTSPMVAIGGELAPISNDCSDSPSKHRNLEAVINGTNRIYGGVIQQLRWVGGFMKNFRGKNTTASFEENRPNSSSSTTSPMGANGGELAPILNDCSDSPTKHCNLEAEMDGINQMCDYTDQNLRTVKVFMNNSGDKNSTASSEENRQNSSNSTTDPMGALGGALSPTSMTDFSVSPTKHRNLEAEMDGMNQMCDYIDQNLRPAKVFMNNSGDENSTASSEENRQNSSNSTTYPMGALGGALSPTSMTDFSVSPTKHRNLEAEMDGMNPMCDYIDQNLHPVKVFMNNSPDKNITATSEENHPNSSNSTTSPMCAIGGALSPISITDCSVSPTKHINLEAEMDGKNRKCDNVDENCRSIGVFVNNSCDKNITASSDEKRPKSDLTPTLGNLVTSSALPTTRRRGAVVESKTLIDVSHVIDLSDTQPQTPEILRQPHRLDIDDDGDVIIVHNNINPIVDLSGHQEPPTSRPSILNYSQLTRRRLARAEDVVGQHTFCMFGTTSAKKRRAENPSTNTSAQTANSDVSPTTAPGPTLFMCTVCMESCLQRHPTSTKCGHVFCQECIRHAIRLTHKCPLCNTKLTNSQIFRIY